jgi:hypothetical protein
MPDAMLGSDSPRYLRGVKRAPQEPQYSSPAAPKRLSQNQHRRHGSWSIAQSVPSLISESVYRAALVVVLLFTSNLVKRFVYGTTQAPKK